MGEADFALAFGLDAEKLCGVVEDGFFCGFASIFPSGAAEFVQFRSFPAEADVFSDEVSLFERDAEQRAVARMIARFL